MPKKRTTNRDHAKRQQRPMMEEEVIAAQLEQLVTPVVLAQQKYYRQLGMRDRILNLPSSRVTRDELMVAAVLTLIWRDVAGVRELSRILCLRRISMVQTNTSQPTSIITEIFDISRRNI